MNELVTWLAAIHFVIALYSQALFAGLCKTFNIRLRQIEFICYSVVICCKKMTSLCINFIIVNSIWVISLHWIRCRSSIYVIRKLVQGNQSGELTLFHTLAAFFSLCVVMRFNTFSISTNIFNSATNVPIWFMHSYSSILESVCNEVWQTSTRIHM